MAGGAVQIAPPAVYFPLAMFSSRSLHFAILGIILGASSAYVVAFYRADVPKVEGPLPASHPSVSSGAEVDPAAAISALKEVTEKDPTNSAVWARYGYALLQAKRTDEAALALERSVELQPDDLDVRSLLGAVYWRSGQVEAAKKHLQAALKQSPNDVPTLHVMFMLALENDRDRKKASEILKQIEKADPQYAGLADLRTRLDQEASAGK